MTRLELIKQIADKFPDDTVALYGLGDAYLADNQFQNAIDTFQKIIRLKPDYTAAYRELGKALAKAGKNEEARDIYRKGIEISQKTGEGQTGKEMKVFLNRLEKIER
jgi:Flp pilus assembly protein TadD